MLEGHRPGESPTGRAGRAGAVPQHVGHPSQSLLDRYELRDAAIKVVGIGSVGTACFVLLYMAGEGDPLFLQVKEARASVLERYAGASDVPQSRPARRQRLPAPAAR